MLRAGSLILLAFQLVYTVLDHGEYRRTFAATLPVHIASIAIGFAALVVTLSPRAMRNWRAIALAVCSSSLAMSAWVAILNGDSDVLVASILIVFFGAGALVPWNPRWQGALEASGTMALAAYSVLAPRPASSLAIAWMVLVNAGLSVAD